MPINIANSEQICLDNKQFNFSEKSFTDSLNSIKIP